MFIDIRTENDATKGNHLQTASNDADYDQLLGQAEHGSIPLQSSILRNPWFLKEVAARLQRNEDEVFSDDESFVSITEVLYAGISIWRLRNRYEIAYGYFLKLYTTGMSKGSTLRTRTLHESSP
jgi:hypothetical protein